MWQYRPLRGQYIFNPLLFWRSGLVVLKMDLSWESELVVETMDLY